MITENWAFFGCLSKSEPPGRDQIPFVRGEDGFSDWVSLGTLTVQPDLFQRLRPTKDNGVVTDLLDENCEVADAFGMPWPGSVQGGLQPDCGDLTLTIRMLEGDINLNCEVDLADDQEIAFRYGSFFGNLLYNNFSTSSRTSLRTSTSTSTSRICRPSSAAMVRVCGADSGSGTRRARYRIPDESSAKGSEGLGSPHRPRLDWDLLRSPHARSSSCADSSSHPPLCSS